MRKIFLLLALLVVQSVVAELPPQFIHALNMVEASGKKINVPAGDGGSAIGGLGIHEIYWRDSGVAGKYQDCTNYAYSVRVVNAYLTKYGAKYIANNDFEALARIHNGGPKGNEKDSTLKYWFKVNKYLTK